MNIQQFAAWLDVTPERVESLIAEGMPVGVDGDLDANLCATWLERNGHGSRYGATGVVKTVREVAAAFGMNYTTVAKEWKQNGMPGEKGRYDLALIAAWRDTRKKAPTSSSNGRGMDDGNQQDYKRRLAADVRIREAEAARRERDNKVAEGNIVYRDNVNREVSELIIAARSAFKRIPRKMLPRFPRERAVDLAAELDREIDAVLKMMANWRPTYEDVE